jgi:fibronectin-binding autotransporter adhesin
MFIINFKLFIRAARIMLAAAVVLSLVWPASAVVTWDAGGSATNLYWSNAANWSNDTAPTSTDDVLFNSTGSTSGTVTNQVSDNQTIKDLWYSQYAGSGSIHTTQIDTGKTLKIVGNNATAPTSSTGNYSLFAGNAGGSSTSFSQTVITGGGTLDISNSIGGSTDGDIVVRMSYSDAGVHDAILNLSGLAFFNANVDQILVGFSTADSGSYCRPNGTLYLAKSNTITLNNPGTTTSAGLIIGYAYNRANTTASNLYLGQSNTLNVDNVTVGGKRSIGVLTFNSAFIGPSLPVPTLTMRGKDGTSRVVNITLGDNTSGQTGGSAAAGTVDLTGGSVDIRATSIELGKTQTFATGGTGNGYAATGTLSFNGGTIDTTGLIIGEQLNNLNATARGTVNVSGTGNLVVGIDGITMAEYYGSAYGSYGNSGGTMNVSGSATVTVGGNINTNLVTVSGPTSGRSITSRINISGGSVTVNGDITKGTYTPAASPGTSTTTIVVSGSGALDMGGGGVRHNIGSASSPIDTLTVSGSGILSNVANLSATNFTVRGALTLTGTMTVGNNGKIDMRDSAAHTFIAAALTLPATSSLYYELSSSTSSGSNDFISVNTLTYDPGASNITVYVSPLSASFASGSYTLIQYSSGSNTSNYTVSNTTRNGMSASDNSIDKKVYLTISPVDARALTWNDPSLSNTWDLMTTANWTSSVTGSDMYYDNDTVTFNTKSDMTDTTISLQNSSGLTGFYPGSVTVSANSNYIFNPFSTNDKISGTTGLTKSGTGTLTITMSNDYTGATNLQTGRIILGNDAALGSSTATLTISGSATLDLYNYQLYAKPITVAGSGTDTKGAIVNNNTSLPADTQYNVSNVTLNGDTTIGGTSSSIYTETGFSGLPGDTTGRWAMRASTGTATLSMANGTAHDLYKVGNNQIMLVDVNVDSKLADVYVNEGVLSLEGTTTLGDSTKTVTVDGKGCGQNSGGSILQFHNTSAALYKNVKLKNGGTLYALLIGTEATSSSYNSISGAVAIDSTGGILNAGGYRNDYAANNTAAQLTVSGVIGNVSDSSPGTLTIAGPGTVTLSNPSNSFTGMTDLNDGTLVVTGALPGGITMATSPTSGVTTTLTGTGTIGGTVTDAYTVLISPGASSAAGSVGTLHMKNLIFNSGGGGTVLFDLSPSTSSGNDQLNLSGNLSINGATTISINQLSGPNSLSNGSYCLIYYSGSLLSGSGSVSNLNPSGYTTGTRRTYTIDGSTPNMINLVVAGSYASLVWKGTESSNNWDTSTSNFVWLNGSASDVFYTCDNVTFGSTGYNTVNINTDVSPSSITVSSASNYTFSGYYKITGTTGITKSGNGTLIINNSSANDFTGTVTINNGTLQVGDGSTSSTRIGSGSIVNYAALVFKAASGDDYTLSNNISGSGTVTYSGSNVLTVSGSNSYTGATYINTGTVRATSSTAFGSPTDGATYIASGATLDVHTTEATGLDAKVVHVQGSGVGDNGAIIATTSEEFAFRYLVLDGDTTFGGTAAWHINNSTGATGYATFTANGHDITKVGTGAVWLTSLGAVDPGNIYVTAGVFGVNGASGNPTYFTNTLNLIKPISVSSGAEFILRKLSTAVSINKDVTLEGGTMGTNSSGGTTNIYGGTIRLKKNADTGIGGYLDVYSSTAMTINGPIIDDSTATGGSLYKTGTGTLTLNGTSTYTGDTTISAGTTILNGYLYYGNTSLSYGNVYFNGGTMAGRGTIVGNLTDATSTSIIPGSSTSGGSVGTLTIGGTLTMVGSETITMDLSSSTSSGNDQIIVKTLSMTGASGSTTVAVNPISGYLVAGSYPLIKYTTNSSSGLSMSLSGVLTNSRQTYTFNDDTIGNIDLVVTGSVGNLKWVGDSSLNAWDVVNTQNWLNGSSVDYFYNADNVTFDDNTAHRTVNLNTVVTPASVAVSTAGSYTITGTGRISGYGTLTKLGVGTLIISTSNSYSGGTTVSNGVLQLGNAFALGATSGSVTVNGGTLDVQSYSPTVGGLTLTSGSIIGSGIITSSTTYALQSGTVSAQLAGGTSVGLTKTGAGTVTVSQGNTYSGVTTISNGTLSVSILSPGGSSSGIGNSSNVAANLILNGGALKYTGAAAGTDRLFTLGTGTSAGTLDASGTGTITWTNTGSVAFTGSDTRTLTLTGSNTGNNAIAAIIGNDTSGSTSLTKSGSGKWILSGTNIYTGNTTISDGTLALVTGGDISTSSAISTGASGTFEVDSGNHTVGTISGSGTTKVLSGSLTATSIVQDTLDIGSGSWATLNTAAFDGGSTSGSLSEVPEPATWAMLMLAAMGLGIYWRRRR